MTRYIRVPNRTSISSTAVPWGSTATTSATTMNVSTYGYDDIFVVGDNVKYFIPKLIEHPCKDLTIKLKDGTVIKIDSENNFTIDDSNSKVLYKSNRIREFNRYVNASDLLEEFIKDMGELGARQGNVLEIPIHTFINWLILKAAEQDGDDASDIQLIKQPRCKFCSRYISRSLEAAGFNFCNPSHSEKYFRRLQHG